LLLTPLQRVPDRGQSIENGQHLNGGTYQTNTIVIAKGMLAKTTAR